MTHPGEWLILSEPERERFARKVAPGPTTSGCRIWTGARNSAGYGQMAVKRDGAHRKVYAHRIVATQRFGVFRPELMVDHLCHTRACVNPDHLRLVTNKQNQENRTGANPRSRSGVRGVIWLPRDRRWVGEVRHNNHPHRTRPFHTIAEAAVAVAELRRQIFTHSDMDREVTS